LIVFVFVFLLYVNFFFYARRKEGKGAKEERCGGAEEER